TDKWAAAGSSHRQGFARKPRSLSAKDPEPWRTKKPDPGHRRRDQGVFRYRCAPEECPRDGATPDRDVENEDGQSVRSASGGKGAGPSPRRDREDAGRVK